MTAVALATGVPGIEVLVDHRRESGFTNVYRHKSGWQARPFRRQVVGTFRTPEQAARAVVAWWQARHGEAWPAVYRKRSANGWQVRHDRERHVAAVVVWVDGVPRELFEVPLPPDWDHHRVHWKKLASGIYRTLVVPWARGTFGPRWRRRLRR